MKSAVSKMCNENKWMLLYVKDVELTFQFKHYNIYSKIVFLCNFSWTSFFLGNYWINGDDFCIAVLFTVKEKSNIIKKNFVFFLMTQV